MIINKNFNKSILSINAHIYLQTFKISLFEGEGADRRKRVFGEGGIQRMTQGVRMVAFDFILRLSNY
jgi:hypothetical protein